MFDTSEIDQGMPLRSTKLDKKNKELTDNPHTDFNLYNQKPSLNISYHDPINNNYASDPKYTDINATNNLLNNVIPEQRLTTIINLFSWNFYNTFKQNFHNNKNILISPFSIITNMIILYKGSKDTTEGNIRDFFHFLIKKKQFKQCFK